MIDRSIDRDRCVASIMFFRGGGGGGGGERERRNRYTLGKKNNEVASGGVLWSLRVAQNYSQHSWCIGLFASSSSHPSQG